MPKNDYEKDFFKLMNNSVFEKAMGSVRKCKDIKLVKTNNRRNYLVSQPNYHTAKFFAENLLAIEMNNTTVKMNRQVYLDFSILHISKIVMHEYGDKAKL